MTYSTTRIVLDLDKQDSMEYVTVRTGDTAKKLAVMLKESGTPYSIADGSAAVLAARKPDGTYIYGDCTITDDVIEIVLPATFTAAAGTLAACIHLTESGAALASPMFAILVDDPAAPAQS